MRSAPLTFATLALLACSHPHTSLRRFEGHITMRTIEAGGKESEFTVTAKGDILRVDMPPPPVKAAPGDVTLGHAVYEHATNRVRLFFDSTKEYRDMDLTSRIAAEGATTETPGLEKTGGHSVVAGLPCDEQSVKTPDGGHTDVCLAQGLAYLEMFRVHLGPHKTESPLAREYREHSTFPLRMVELGADGKERARVEVTKVERASVDDDVFTLPSGYAKVDPHFDDAPPPGASSGGHASKAPPH
jgi:hypothetical protein